MPGGERDTGGRSRVRVLSSRPRAVLGAVAPPVHRVTALAARAIAVQAVVALVAWAVVPAAVHAAVLAVVLAGVVVGPGAPVATAQPLIPLPGGGAALAPPTPSAPPPAPTDAAGAAAQLDRVQHDAEAL